MLPKIEGKKSIRCMTALVSAINDSSPIVVQSAAEVVLELISSSGTFSALAHAFLLTYSGAEADKRLTGFEVYFPIHCSLKYLRVACKLYYSFECLESFCDVNA